MTGESPLVFRHSINTLAESFTSSGAPRCSSAAIRVSSKSMILTCICCFLFLVGARYRSFQGFHAGCFLNWKGVCPKVFLNARENDSGFSKPAASAMSMIRLCPLKTSRHHARLSLIICTYLKTVTPADSQNCRWKWSFEKFATRRRQASDSSSSRCLSM